MRCHVIVFELIYSRTFEKQQEAAEARKQRTFQRTLPLRYIYIIHLPLDAQATSQIGISSSSGVIHSVSQSISVCLSFLISRVLYNAESIPGSNYSRLGANGAPQGEAEGAGSPRSEGREPGDQIRRAGPDREEVRRRIEQESGGGGGECEEAGRRHGGGGSGSRIGGGEAGDSEGAAGEEDEPGGGCEADQRAHSGGAGVRERQGRAESGRSGEAGEGFRRQTPWKIRQVNFENRSV